MCYYSDVTLPWKRSSILTLNPLSSTIVAPSSNASKWQMGSNSAFKELICNDVYTN